MAEPLKNIYSVTLINQLSTEVAKEYANFDAIKFCEAVIANDWDNLELKQRMRRITEVLGDYLPKEYSTAIEILLPVSKSFSGLGHMIFPDFVEVYGEEHFELSMKALAEFTSGSTSEFAIRPFIIKQPEKTMKQMAKWARSRNEHKRRLASEGCRPRLPWAMALPEFKRDPQQVLQVIVGLINDNSLYVRRSVANNLNDISKDHPQRVVDLAEQYLGQSKNVDWVIKHACRGLLKSGDKRVLELFGFAKTEHVQIEGFKVDSTVKRGDKLCFEFAIRTQQLSLGSLRIEVIIDFMKSNGSNAGKIFKISEGEFREASKEVYKCFSFKPISTRKYYPGTHQLTIVINGKKMASKSFQLT